MGQQCPDVRNPRKVTGNLAGKRIQKPGEAFEFAAGKGAVRPLRMCPVLVAALPRSVTKAR